MDFFLLAKMCSFTSISLLVKVVILTLLVEINVLANGIRKAEDIFDYFPEAQNDASNIRFFRVNTKEEMLRAPKSTAIIYGDVWQLLNKTIVSTTSTKAFDYGLEDWLTSVLKNNVGIKLNFKETKVVFPALKILQRFSKDIGESRPVWLSADLEEGPYNAKGSILDKKFFKLSKAFFSNVTFSVNWVTAWNKELSSNKLYYSWEHIWSMLKYLQNEALIQPINFEFRLSFIDLSEDKLRFLFDIFPSSTAMIWANSLEIDNELALFNVRKKFNHSRIFYNLPKDTFIKFYNKKNNSEHLYQPESDSYQFDHIWSIKSLNNDSNVYIGSKSAIVPGKDTVLKSRRRYGTSSNKTIILTGSISVIDNNFYNTFVRINFYNESNSIPIKNCSFSSKANVGCDNNAKQIKLSPPRIMRCFIFKVEVLDNGPKQSRIGNAFKIDTCHIEMENYAHKKADYSISLEDYYSNPWESVQYFENVSISIHTESLLGFVVLERISVIGELQPLTDKEFQESLKSSIPKEKNDVEIGSPDYEYIDLEKRDGSHTVSALINRNVILRGMCFIAFILFIF